MDDKELARMARKAQIETVVLVFATIMCPVILRAYWGVTIDTAAICFVVLAAATAIYSAVATTRLQVLWLGRKKP
jgi:hypothetical protein